MKLKNKKLDSLFNQYFGKHIEIEDIYGATRNGVVCGYDTNNGSLIISTLAIGWTCGVKYSNEFIHKDYIGNHRTYLNTNINSKIVLL